MRKNSNIAYIVLIVALVISAVFSINLFFLEKSDKDIVSVLKFPNIVGQWQGKDLPITEKEYKILETRNLITKEYKNKQGEKIYLFVIYSETNRSVFHPPEVCMVGGGLDLVNKESVSMPLRSVDITLNKMNAEKKNYKELVLYCYKAGNIYTSSYYLQQAYLALHQLFGKRVPGATIRVSMKVGRNESQTYEAESIRELEALK